MGDDVPPEQFPPEGFEHWPGDLKNVGPDDREVRVLFPRDDPDPGYIPYPHPVVVDFDPKACDPDPDVWPRPTDPGTVDDVDELHIKMGTRPAPHVRWITTEMLEECHIETPNYSPDIDPEVWRQIEREHDLGANEDDGPPEVLGMEMTEPRVEALRRIARLWNCDFVRGNHILADKLPSWDTILGDLNQDELERLSNDPSIDDQLVEAFGGMPWFDFETIFCDSEYVLRKRVDWAPTQTGRSLINAWDDLPDLRGDPNESLRHRFAVMLSAAWLTDRRVTDRLDRVRTYKELANGYVIDALGHNATKMICIEVETDHNNIPRRRDTFSKFKDLHGNGLEVKTIAVFPTRETAYNVLSTWQQMGDDHSLDVSFDGDPRISWAREKVQEAYEESSWPVADFFTTDWLWRQTFRSDDYDFPDDRKILQFW